MKTTRGQIIDILQRQKRATVEELALSLGLAAPTVRRHLDVLQRDNLVGFRVIHRKLGRPHYVYFLTEGGQEQLPRNYHHLVAGLIAEMQNLTATDLRGLDGKGLLVLTMRRVAERMAASYSYRVAGKDLRERVAELVRILNEEGYFSEYYEENGTLKIVNFNCPYHQVALSHPEVYGLCLSFMKRMLSAEVGSFQCQAGGDNPCVFLVQKELGNESEPSRIVPAGSGAGR